MNFVDILNALSDEELLNLAKKICEKDIESLNRLQLTEMLVNHEANQLSNGERFYQGLEK